MKKYIFISILLIYVAILFFSEAKNLSVPQVTRVEQAKINDYQESIDRENELKRMMEDPTIIRSELKKTGAIISLKGSDRFYKKITDKDKIFNKFTLREITIDFNYTYGIGISNLDYLKIMKIEGTTVYINIPKSRIQLLYIQQNSDSKIIDGDKMFLVKHFSPSDTQTISTIVQEIMANRIGTNKDLFETAMINLQDELEKSILNMGYYQNVIFEQI